MTFSLILDGLPWLLAGALIGTVYFFLLGRSVAAIGDQADWRKAVGYLVLRMGFAVCGFAVAAMQGAAPLLFTLVGLLLARMVAIRRVKGS